MNIKDLGKRYALKWRSQDERYGLTIAWLVCSLHRG